MSLDLDQPFPSIPAPFVEVRGNDGQVIGKGYIEQVWIQLLIALWTRTGGPAGISSEAALLLSLAEETRDDNNSAVSLAGLFSEIQGSQRESLQLLIQDTVREEIAKLGLEISPSELANPLLALLFSSGESSSTTTDDDSTSWVPTVDGSESPNFITDGAGNLIFVAWHP